jgi:hypothetical protein
MLATYGKQRPSLSDFRLELRSTHDSQVGFGLGARQLKAFLPASKT